VKGINKKCIGFFYNGLVLDGAIHIVCHELLKIFLISKFLQLKPKNQDIHGQKAHTGHLITKESAHGHE